MSKPLVRRWLVVAIVEAEEGFMTCLFMVDLESGEAKPMFRDGEVWSFR